MTACAEVRIYWMPDGSRVGAACLLDAGHDGMHEWTPVLFEPFARYFQFPEVSQEDDEHTITIASDHRWIGPRWCAATGRAGILAVRYVGRSARPDLSRERTRRPWTQ